MTKAVFFDAAGTLIHLRQPVGESYAEIAAGHGIVVEPDRVEQAFRAAWKRTPSPLHPPDQPPADDDRAWWKSLVRETFAEAVGRPLAESPLEYLFDDLYSHFSKADAWRVYDDVLPTLKALQALNRRLLVLSNFDRRLRSILAGHGLDRYFHGMVISSEVGASKPHPRMFEAALRAAQAHPHECLHVGDEVKADLEGAQAAGMTAFRVNRPEAGLDAVLSLVSR